MATMTARIASLPRRRPQFVPQPGHGLVLLPGQSSLEVALDRPRSRAAQAEARSGAARVGAPSPRLIIPGRDRPTLTNEIVTTSRGLRLTASPTASPCPPAPPSLTPSAWPLVDGIRMPVFLANVRPVIGIIERQHDAMEAMRSSFDLAMHVQPPPGTRQALADMVHRLREDPPPAAVLMAQARDAGPAILALVGQELTPERAEEIQQAADEIGADPELRGKLRRVAERVDWSAIGALTPWAALCAAAVLLFKVAVMPVTEQLSAAQNAALSNWFMALAVIVALATIIITIQKK